MLDRQAVLGGPGEDQLQQVGELGLGQLRRSQAQRQLRQTLEADRDQWKAKAEAGDKQVYELTVERNLDGLLATAGVTDPTFQEAARVMLKPQIKVEDGKPFVDTDMGPLALADYIPRWTADKGKVFVSQPKGGGAKGGEGGSKPLAEMVDAERLQLAQQGKLKAAQAAD